jgi:outer membrane biosynthesis protein TonB
MRVNCVLCGEELYVSRNFPPGSVKIICPSCLQKLSSQPKPRARPEKAVEKAEKPKPAEKPEKPIQPANKPY